MVALTITAASNATAAAAGVVYVLGVGDASGGIILKINVTGVQAQ